MSPERLRDLLDNYGSRESNWPSELRESMRAALDSLERNNSLERWDSLEPGESLELRVALREARELDELLDSYAPPLAQLEQRILEALPQPLLERLFSWLVPERGSELWRPALAAALPLLLGVTLGLNGLLSESDTGVDWAAQEQYLLALPAEDLWDE